MPRPSKVFNVFRRSTRDLTQDAKDNPADNSADDVFDDGDEARRKLQRDLNYHPFPKQREFHRCNAKYRLFGGAAGPGKSKALLMEAIRQALDNAGANTLLLRRTFPELEGSLLLYFRRDVPRELYRSFNEAKHTVTWHNGSTTRFGYSQNENDIYQYQSSEFLFIGIDELTHFTLRQWQFLTSRNRCPVPGSHPSMAGATNPGNIGHAWVKSLFIDNQPAAGMEPREYDSRDYAFIAARVSDNPIYANDSAYLKTLEQLPDFYRRAFLDGDWSVFAGQYFSNFDPSRNVIRAEAMRAEAWWPRWISIDWGFEHPAAVYWHTSAPARPLPGCHSERVPIAFTGTTGFGLQTPMQSTGPSKPENLKLAGEPQGHRQDSLVGSGLSLPVVAGPDLLSASQHQSGGPTGRPYEEVPHHFDEEQRHRLKDSQTRERGDGPSAKNVATPPAGDAAPSSIPTRLASRVPDAAALANSAVGSFDAASSFSANGSSDANAEMGGPTDRPYEEVPHHFDQEQRHHRQDSLVGSGLSPDLLSASQHQSGGPKGRPYDNVAGARATTITYREFIAQHLSPRVLAAQIIERSRARDGVAEKISAIYLSPDAFARRTDESSIAEQMGDILQAAGLPRPVPADNDRIGGWMLMYQMLDAREWLLTDSCPELIRTLPELVRDDANVEDIAKRDGDDAADAARYGLKSRASAQPSRPPREQEFAQRVTSADPTIRAIQARKAELELPQKNRPVFGRFSRWRRR